MFMLKSLFGKIWGDENNAELVQIPAGALYLVRSGAIKSDRECIYKDAVATIRRTSIPFNYQLVITRAYDEGDEALLDDDDESDDEKSFLIDPSLAFRLSSLRADPGAHDVDEPDNPTLLWRDLGEDLDVSSQGISSSSTPAADAPDQDLFQFVIDGDRVNAVTRSVFEVTYLQCCFERVHGRSHDEAADEEIEALKYKPERLYPSIPAAPATPNRSSAARPDQKSSLASRSAAAADTSASFVSAAPTSQEHDTSASDIGNTSHASAAPVEHSDAGNTSRASAAPAEHPDAGNTSAVVAASEEQTDATDTRSLSAVPPENADVGNTSSAPEERTDKATSAAPERGSKPTVPAAPNAEDLPPLIPGTEESGNPVAVEAVADLYLYDEASGLFMSQEKNAVIKVVEAGQYMYWMTIQSSPDNEGQSRLWLSQRVAADMNMNFAADNLSAVWNYFVSNPESKTLCYSWLLRFYKRPAYEEFQQGFSACLWQTLNEQPLSKLKPVEKQYLYEAYEEDVDMAEPDDANDDADDAAVDQALGDTINPIEEEDELSDSDEQEDDAGNVGDQPEGMPDETEALARDLNSQLAIGYKNDRAFVVRGNRIGVFKTSNSADGQPGLEFSTTINNVSTPKGKAFNPRKAMLHDSDTAMVLMDPKNEHSVYKMDLEYGKIVEEWGVHEDVQVSNVLPSAKFAQMTSEQTLVGTSHNAVYRIDPRVSGQKLVDGQFKQYATKSDFSSAATDASGRLVVASNKGDLRLFDQIGKNAKTALPALGDPITGVDVTSDGRYVLATCKTYLLLIDTLIGDGRWAGSLGFDKSFPANSKPIPRRLQLKPHHVAYMGQAVEFTPARFDVGENDETSIVTSSGQFVIAWSFESVKRGKTHDYQIRRYADTVVQDEYGYNSRNIVVALPHDVALAKKQTLKKPTRASLATL